MNMEVLRAKHADLLEGLVRMRQKASVWMGGTAEGECAVVSPPLGEEDVLWFETQCAVTLPAAYRLYLREIGNDWPGLAGQADGLYPLGHGLGDEEGELPAFGLARSCVLVPGMAARTWSGFAMLLEAARHQDALRYADALASVYGGLLPVGRDGRRVHCLVLNGPLEGRVVDIDPAGEMAPEFAPEADFLLWLVRILEASHGVRLLSPADALA